MTRARPGTVTAIVLLACSIVPNASRADDAEPIALDSIPTIAAVESADSWRPSTRRTKPRLEALVPELAEHPYRLAPGVRPFQNRLSFSPAYGRLGTEPIYALRIAFNPSPWLGYEASLGHNPGDAVHAVIHSLSALVRVPIPGRLQPFGTVGYGMMMVSPGPALNADPVTKNAVTAGGGLEFYVRSDFALRADVASAVVFGKERDREGVVAYDYMHATVGISLYRSIRP